MAAFRKTNITENVRYGAFFLVQFYFQLAERDLNAMSVSQTHTRQPKQQQIRTADVDAALSGMISFGTK